MIRLLTAEDFALWRSIRLEALGAHPAAYNGSQEEETRKTERQWAQELDEAAIFAYLSDGIAVGVAGYRTEKILKKKHIGTVFTVYVKPEMRGKGVIDWLMQALSYHAQGHGVEQLHLGVGVYNEPALRCYERLGFAHYGTELRTIKLGEEYIDEYLMVKFL